MLVKFKMKKKDWTGIFLTARVQRLYKEYEDNIVSGLETASGLSFRRGFTIVVSDITDDHSTWFLGSGIDKKEAALIELDASAVIGDDLILWILINLTGCKLLGQNRVWPQTVKNKEILNERWSRLVYSFSVDAIEIGFGSQHTKSIMEHIAKDSLGVSSDKAWKWAISMMPKQRKAAWKKLKASYSHSLHRPANI